MRPYLVFTLIFSLLTLIGCTNPRPEHLRTNPTQETWQQEVITNPDFFLKGADRWFFTGGPNRTELALREAPISSAISTTAVNVPKFNSLRIDGAFQVQIFGSTTENTVFIYGQNSAIHNVAIDVLRHTLYIHQIQNVAGMKSVIIRIGVRTLNNLTQLGAGKIEVMRMNSNNLCITTGPLSCGNIYLSGNIVLTSVRHEGRGNINVIGANTPVLDITSTGSGCINIAGNVGVKSIKHVGSGDINIIGVNTDNLQISANGSGKIGLQGPANITKIEANQLVRVFAYPVMSHFVKVSVCDNAHVGLAGITNDLVVNAFGNGRFDGRCLCAQNAYLQATDNAYINVTAAALKTFATANQAATIYYYGSANRLSSFVNNTGTVITLRNIGGPMCLVRTPRILKAYRY